MFGSTERNLKEVTVKTLENAIRGGMFVGPRYDPTPNPVKPGEIIGLMAYADRKDVMESRPSARTENVSELLTLIGATVSPDEVERLGRVLGHKWVIGPKPGDTALIAYSSWHIIEYDDDGGMADHSAPSLAELLATLDTAS